MKVGLALSSNLVSEDGARLAVQIGATDIVVHPTNYACGEHRDALGSGLAIRGEQRRRRDQDTEKMGGAK